MSLGKILIITGVVILTAGIIITFLPKLNFFGKLPGDFSFGSENFKVYIPIATSILISIILTLIFFLISYFSRK